MKRLLLIGDPNSIYLNNYASQLRLHFGSDLVIDLFSTFPPLKKPEVLPYDHIFGVVRRPSSPFSRYRIFTRPIQLRKFLTSYQGRYDVAHVLYCIQDLMVTGSLLRNFAPRVILTVFGSDFFQLQDWKKPWFRHIFKSADFITSNNSRALDSIRNAFRLEPEQMKICRFGFNSLEKLKEVGAITQIESRDILHIMPDKTVICIGYNYDSIQQHIPVIQSIANNGDLLARKKELFFLFPLTYGTESGYKAQLIRALETFPFEYKTMQQFLSEEENAHLRKAPDIMIQVQKSDSFSASTQEHMYAGNLLITGDWLPYDDLKEAGIYYRTVESPTEIGNQLPYVLNNLQTEKDKCKKNPEAIYRLSSWNANLPSWLALYK